MAVKRISTVNKIYVEKKKEFADEALSLAKELKNFLKIGSIKEVRILHRYLIEGLDQSLFNKSISDILSTEGLDDALYELPDSDYILPMELLPGQFDQRADSCAENIRLINKGIKPKVEYAKMILFYGSINSEEFSRIEDYLINPVESRKASLEIPAFLKTFDDETEEVPVLKGFTLLGEEEAEEFLQSHSLAMDTADLLFCRDYFKSENRDPTLTELKMIDTYWSDHCRHTTFFTEIDNIEIEDETVKASFEEYIKMKESLGRQDKATTLMDLATIGARYLKQKGLLTDLDQSPEVNACSVHIDVDVDGKKEPWLLMFKNETHNHPTEMEPFGGAATCLGGAIRDPLSGRAYVYHAMRISGAYNPLLGLDKTLPGKLPQRTIAKQAAAGYSSYGNQIGVPAGLVREIYHPGYQAKRMEMGAVVAAAPAHQVVRKEPEQGDVVILLGGKTGRDGLGGATGSSKSHDSSSLEKSGPQVQKGNAPEESKIQRLFRRPELTKLIKRCNDFGAGGVSVAVGELADSLCINLDKVPLKYPGLDGTEIAISESQERMAVVVDSEDVSKFLSHAQEENLEATVIAQVTNTGRLVMTFKGQNIVDLSREFLDSNGTVKRSKVKVPSLTTVSDMEKVERIDSLQTGFEVLAQNLNHCSQKGLSQIFDFSAGGYSVLAPFGGLYEETPIQAMVSQIPVLKGESSTCSLASFGFDPYISEANPYKGAYLAVIHSVGKLLATGGNIDKCWLSFQEYFERLEDDPVKWGKPFAALLGALQAQKDLSLAAIGGKDSMSGSFEDIHVPPTLVSVAVCLGEVSNILSPEYKSVGNPIVYMNSKDTDILDFYKKVQKLIQEGKVLSAYALSAKGIGEAIFEMALGNKIGIRLTDAFAQEYDENAIFKADYGSFLLELNPEYNQDSSDYPGVLIGHTTDTFGIESKDFSVDFSTIRELYLNKLTPVYPMKKKSFVAKEAFKQSEKISSLPKRKTKANFLIPIVPGNQGEYQLCNKIEEAGGNARIFVFKNLDQYSIQESLKEFADEIASSRCLVLPGGMALGDEPDGGGKYVASMLKSPEVAKAIQHMLKDQDGLILGIGSGFQALMRAGLLPEGFIVPSTEYYCGFKEIEICGTNTPWFNGMKPGDIQKMPVSWSGNALHFNDLDVNIVAKFLTNSPEAITSPCGKIMGRIGSFERTGKHFCKNISNLEDINIFHGAVSYLG